MKTTIAFACLFVPYIHQTFAQHERGTTDTTRHIDEVEVSAKVTRMVGTDMKVALTVDEFLASSEQISFIKRGAYGWEPLLNNMTTERSVITIDGMHIFGACTDKMDPVTSYVESNTLAAVNISSGQAGSMHGATVAGSIDMRRKQTPFGLEKRWNATYQTGFESNNKQFFHLGNLAFSSDKLVTEGSIAFRNAVNYHAGNGVEVDHSQYNKLNGSVGLGYKVGPLSSLRVDAIFDRASDVGYPALPMDLWLSRTLVVSAGYKQLFERGVAKIWDTKLYFNAVEHYMDDTKRPDNLVHMDMPGWSTTYGLVSKVNLMRGDYSSDIQLNLYENLSIAEMTMYPQDRGNKTMFAYSWPWVTTRFAGASFSNAWHVGDGSQVNFGGTLGLNYNHAKYPEFNRIFYPEAAAEKSRVLPGLHASYAWRVRYFDFDLGIGYGHRAPSVSEGYGYYIYNSFDRYDYVGNPDLPNEIAYEANAQAAFHGDGMGFSVSANYFHIENYIVGRILNLGSPMNYQSVGVKGYFALDYARLFNLAVNAHYDILTRLHWKGTLTYARAKDSQGSNLPFIRPLSYFTALHYMHGRFGAGTTLHGDFAQRHHGPQYGEDRTPAYGVWNLSAHYTFSVKGLSATVQVGAENLLNEHYSTYADWGNIPRMGRNLFTSLRLEL